jgi:argininosuccinate lyase
MNKGKLWGGRFQHDTHDVVEEFTASDHFDRRLASYDIAGSIAHARMLAARGILSRSESEAIVEGLRAIAVEIEEDRFQWSAGLEDVHMNIEARLTERIGEAGKKLHTARSRNDQVATDMRLFVCDAIDRLCTGITGLQKALVEVADNYAEAIMPGMTHLQNAQPVTCGHHMLAWVEMLERDWQRMGDCRTRADVMPLGSAALAGTSFDIDRQMTADELGFKALSRNSLDAVSDRDFVIELASSLAILAVHFSRMAEELVLWASEPFGFIDLGDAFCTGSSIMPQKKNPDVAELVRGKTGRVVGHLVSLLILMKGQPLAYNRDNQEDKEPVFDGVDTALACLDVLTLLVAQMKFDQDKMRQAAERGHATATDLADYLVRKGLPFRDAHEIVGRSVAAAQTAGVDLAELPLESLRGFSDQIDDDIFDVLTLDGSVAARDHPGGTAPARVRYAVREARKRLAQRSAGAG